tara:strand:+ start:30 stop:380 length:351 start_codon:yes stop_codon:yes gene_type:complete
MANALNKNFQQLASFKMLETQFGNHMSEVSNSGNKDRKQADVELRAVADQFEAIFLEILLKQARESKLSDGLFDTSSDDNFVQMYDQELAKSSSKSVDIGIAEAIIEQMSSSGLKR